MTSSARPPRRSPSPWLVGALVAGAAAWARSWNAAPRGLTSPVMVPYPQPQTQPVTDHRQALGELEATLARERQRAALLQLELQHLVKVRLPAALAGAEVPPAERPGDVAPEMAARLEELLALIGTELTEREESRRLALVELAGRVQTSAHRIQQAMSGLAERYPGDPDLLETSMRVDHAATQQARHAQSVKVLCDEWPGQQWPAALALVDVARAASGRIVAFDRVQVTGDQTVAVGPSVVEPLIHLVAELLANATEYSAPTSPVTVAVRGVQRGAVIEVDDSGFGLDEYRLTQSREIVSGRRLLGVSDVGEIPQTGFAVVGRFARRHGLTVDLGISPYGGLRAVVLIPNHLVETVALPAAPAVPLVEPPSVTETPDPSGDAPGPADDERPEPRRSGDSRRITPDDPSTASEIQLPQRRSTRRRDPAALFRAEPGEPAAPVLPAAPDTAPEEAGEWMERYFQGSQPLPITPTTNESDLGGDSPPETVRKEEGQG